MTISKEQLRCSELVSPSDISSDSNVVTGVVPSMAVNSANQTSSFNFLGLPPEIRRIIYRQVLGDTYVVYAFQLHKPGGGKSIKLVEFDIKEPRRFVSDQQCRAVLMVSKQLHTEASSLFFPTVKVKLCHPQRGKFIYTPDNYQSGIFERFTSRIATLEIDAMDLMYSRDWPPLPELRVLTIDMGWRKNFVAQVYPSWTPTSLLRAHLLNLTTFDRNRYYPFEPNGHNEHMVGSWKEFISNNPGILKISIKVVASAVCFWKISDEEWSPLERWEMTVCEDFVERKLRTNQPHLVGIASTPQYPLKCPRWHFVETEEGWERYWSEVPFIRWREPKDL